MRKIFFLIAAGSIFVSVLADARMGGGRSFGVRGSRGFSATRPAYTPTYNSNVYRTSAPSSAMSAAPQTVSGSGFMRGMLGGLAGGFLGSMLFRQLGYAGMGASAGGGVGILEILLIAGLGFFLFRLLVARSAATASAGPGMAPTMHSGSAGEPLRGTRQADAPVDVLRRYDVNFDPQRFKDALTDGFFAVQSAWARRDLTPVQGMLTPEIRAELEGQLSEMRANGRVNRLENIAVREIDLLEAWQELGKEFATVRFYANLLDYTVDEKSGQVISGSSSSPIKFEEFWTYSRDVGTGSPWRLAAVEQA